MKKRVILSISAILFTAVCCAAQTTVSHSAITFKIKNLGIYTSGTIGGLQATVHFNPADIATATVEATVNVNTIDTDNSMRDDHVKSDEFFDAARYPKITLKSTTITHKSGNKYSGQFNLTIKNKTKAVTIPFTYTANGGAQAFNGSFKINRRDFGVGDDSLTLSDEVIVSIDAELKD